MVGLGRFLGVVLLHQLVGPDLDDLLHFRIQVRRMDFADAGIRDRLHVGPGFRDSDRRVGGIHADLHFHFGLVRAVGHEAFELESSIHNRSP